MAFIGGTFLVVVTIFVVFSIYWGSLFRLPAHPLNGWIVVCAHLSGAAKVTIDQSEGLRWRGSWRIFLG